MLRLGWAVVLLAVASGVQAADDRDPLVRARSFYNQRKFEAAIVAADQARLVPGHADTADLVAARALLERYRERSDVEDLGYARARLSRIDPQHFGARERVEYIVGLGETLYFENSYGAAADVFASVLAPPGLVVADERERVIDWWASALDRDAATRTAIERRDVYERVRLRMTEELGVAPSSVTASYWLSMAARGEGDLQGAWDAAQAGWLRAPMAGDRGVKLREDIDRLVLDALVPERSRALGQPPDTLREEWERFKGRWARE